MFLSLLHHVGVNILIITGNDGWDLCTIAGKINGTPKGVRLSEKLQLTAALCSEI